MFVHERWIVKDVLLTTSVWVAFFLHLFEFVCIGSANEVSLHVVDVAFGVHEVLLILSLDLNAAHHDIILDVNALFLFVATLKVLAAPGDVRDLLLLVEVHLQLLMLRRFMVLLVIVGIVDVLLLQLRWGGIQATNLIVVVAVLEILHLEQVVISSLFLIAMLLMYRLPHCLVLLLLSVHLKHVVTLGFGSAIDRFKRWESIHWSPHVIGPC